MTAGPTLRKGIAVFVRYINIDGAITPVNGYDREAIERLTPEQWEEFNEGDGTKESWIEYLKAYEARTRNVILRPYPEHSGGAALDEGIGVLGMSQD